MEKPQNTVNIVGQEIKDKYDYHIPNKAQIALMDKFRDKFKELDSMLARLVELHAKCGDVQAISYINRADDRLNIASFYINKSIAVNDKIK